MHHGTNKEDHEVAVEFRRPPALLGNHAGSVSAIAVAVQSLEKGRSALVDSLTAREPDGNGMLAQTPDGKDAW